MIIKLNLNNMMKRVEEEVRWGGRVGGNGTE